MSLVKAGSAIGDVPETTPFISGHYPRDRRAAQSPGMYEALRISLARTNQKALLRGRYISQVICPVTNAIATACARVCAPSLPSAL